MMGSTSGCAGGDRPFECGSGLPGPAGAVEQGAGQGDEVGVTGLQDGCDPPAYFSPSWTAFQADRGRDFSVIVDGISN